MLSESSLAEAIDEDHLRLVPCCHPRRRGAVVPR
jgi:hypothetical protein